MVYEPNVSQNITYNDILLSIIINRIGGVQPMAIVKATDQNFAEETSKGLVVADFWATWCGPCKMIAPVLEEISSEMGDQVKIVKLDVDENQETAAKYGVMSIPTLIFFKDGEIVDKVIGYRPKEALEEVINNHL